MLEFLVIVLVIFLLYDIYKLKKYRQIIVIVCLIVGYFAIDSVSTVSDDGWSESFCSTREFTKENYDNRNVILLSHPDGNYSILKFTDGIKVETDKKCACVQIAINYPREYDNTIVNHFNVEVDSPFTFIDRGSYIEVNLEDNNKFVYHFKGAITSEKYYADIETDYELLVIEGGTIDLIKKTEITNVH